MFPRFLEQVGSFFSSSGSVDSFLRRLFSLPPPAPVILRDTRVGGNFLFFHDAFFFSNTRLVQVFFFVSFSRSFVFPVFCV